MSQVAMPPRAVSPTDLDAWARHLEASASAPGASPELRDARLLAAKMLEVEAVRAVVAQRRRQ
jgi:hypothetical protein